MAKEVLEILNNDDNKKVDPEPETVSAIKARGWLTQAKEQAARASELAAELEKYKVIEKEKQEKDLLAKSEFEKLVAMKEAESKELQAKLATVEAQRKQDAYNLALVEAGITNSYMRTGIVAEYTAMDEKTRPELADHLKTLKEKQPQLFEVKTNGITTNGVVVKQNNITYTKADLDDPAKVAEATAYAEKYVMEHGALPEGF